MIGIFNNSSEKYIKIGRIKMKKTLILLLLILSTVAFSVDFSLGIGGGIDGTTHNGKPWIAPGLNVSVSFDINEGFGIGGTTSFTLKEANDSMILNYGDVFFNIPVSPYKDNFYLKLALSGGALIDNTIDKNDTRHLMFGWGLDARGKLIDNVNIRGFFRAFRVENCMSTMLFQTLVAGVQFEFEF